MVTASPQAVTITLKCLDATSFVAAPVLIV